MKRDKITKNNVLTSAEYVKSMKSKPEVDVMSNCTDLCALSTCTWEEATEKMFPFLGMINNVEKIDNSCWR